MGPPRLPPQTWDLKERGTESSARDGAPSTQIKWWDVDLGFQDKKVPVLIASLDFQILGRMNFWRSHSLSKRFLPRETNVPLSLTKEIGENPVRIFEVASQGGLMVIGGRLRE